MKKRQTKKSTTKKPVTQNLKDNTKVVGQLHNLVSIIKRRSELASRLGQTYDGNRNLYTVCGYDVNLDYNDFNAKYLRGDITKRIVDAYPNSTWSVMPDINETEDKEQTQFEKEVDSLFKDKKLRHYFNRADRLACIGQYAVLFMGFDDGKDLDEPVDGAKELMYLQAYSEGNANIVEYETDIKNPRYGKPTYYQLKLSTSDPSSSTSVRVHHSRIIHVVTDPLENDILGIPLLESVYNRLQDLEKVLACSSEMYWLGAFQGLAFSTREGAEISEQDASALEDEIENFMHNLSRYIRLNNMDVKSLSPNITPPDKQLDALLTVIAATIGIPKRILLGTEEAKLAGNQDAIQWNSRIAERRQHFATPFMLMPFIDRMIELGILPAPKGGYTIEWPAVNTPTEIQVAETAKVQSEAMGTYVQSGSDMLMPPQHYLTDILKLSDEKAEAILNDALLGEPAGGEGEPE